MLTEADDYYVLAWRPAPELFRGAKFHRIEVRVPTHKDVTVRVHRGFFTDEALARAGERTNANAALEPWQQLATAIRADQFKGALPTYLTADYLDTPESGAALALLLRVPVEQTSEGQTPNAVDIAGAIYDARGNAVVSFIERLAVNQIGRAHV